MTNQVIIPRNPPCCARAWRDETKLFSLSRPGNATPISGMSFADDTAAPSTASTARARATLFDRERQLAPQALPTNVKEFLP
jgi:hypothetical protein